MFDPTVPIQQPTYDIDTDILGLGRRFELYFRLQAQKQVYINTRDRTSMFLKAVASSEYADIVTTLQSNVDSYRHNEDEYFLPVDNHRCQLGHYDRSALAGIYVYLQKCMTGLTVSAYGDIRRTDLPPHFPTYDCLRMVAPAGG